MTEALDATSGREQRWRQRVAETGAEAGPLQDGVPVAFTRPATSEGWWPGQAPYVRGRQEAAPHRALPWRLCARIKDSTLRGARERIEREVEGGCDAILIVGDAPARAVPGGSRGRGGVPLRNAAELAELWAPVPTSARLLFLADGNALPVAALGLAALQQLGRDPREAQLDLLFDPLHTLMRLGRLPGSWEQTTAELAELVPFCERELPRSRALGVSTMRPHKAGAAADTELALALAGTAELLRAAGGHGIGPDRVLRQLCLRVAVDQDVFPQIAKLRALRWVLAKLQAASGVDGAPPPVHALPSPRCLTRRAPWINVLRTTTQTFAAAVAGADLIETAPHDSTLGPSTPEAERLARNLQLVLAHEAGLGRHADAAGGSYALEARSEALARAAWERFREIERAGGLRAALHAGRIRAMVDADRQLRDDAVARRRRRVLGVSAYPRLDEARPRDACALPDGSDLPVAGPAERATPASLPELVELACNGVGLRELAGARLRTGPAETCLPPLRAGRDGASLEALRGRVDEADPRFARVALLALGSPAEHRRAASFARELFSVAGLTLETLPAEGALEAFEQSGARAAFVADGPELPVEERAAAVDALRERGARAVYLRARGPDDLAPAGAQLLRDDDDVGEVLSPLIRELLELCREVAR